MIDIKNTNIRTGFSLIDETLGGFRRGALHIIESSTTFGKTTLGLSIVKNAAFDLNYRVHVASIESSSDDVFIGVTSNRHHIKSRDLRTGNLTLEELEKMISGEKDGVQRLTVGGGRRGTVEEVIDGTFILERAPDLILVDYLELLIAEKRTDNRCDEVLHILRQLRKLALDIGAAVVIVSQRDRQPLLTTIITQEVETIITITEGLDLSGEARDVTVTKNRHGPKGSVEMRHNKPYSRFEDVQPKH